MSRQEKALPREGDRASSNALSDYLSGVGQIVFAFLKPLRYSVVVVTECLYDKPIISHFAIARDNSALESGENRITETTGLSNQWKAGSIGAPKLGLRCRFAHHTAGSSGTCKNVPDIVIVRDQIKSYRAEGFRAALTDNYNLNLAGDTLNFNGRNT